MLPCLDEATTLGPLLEECRRVLGADVGVRWTVLVVDNGSRDGSPEIAAGAGAEVLRCARRGYGAAVDAGLRAARTPWVLYADADGTYDPRDACRLLAHARAHPGTELVVGSRLAGPIEPGAMPALHRYLGTPVLSAVYRGLHRVPLGDVNSGLRCLWREAYLRWDVRAPGMEFASAMLVAAADAGAVVRELPIGLRRGPPGRTPHLRPWRDGLRHLRVLLGAAAWRAPLVACLVLATVGLTGLLAPGEWYADDVTLRLQVEALLRGELALQAWPHHHLQDWGWSTHGAQQLWGLGVPLLRLPFEAAASALGAGPFPDRLVLVLVLTLSLGLWLRGAHAALARAPAVAALLTAVVYLHPVLLALLGARLAVYEEVIAVGVWLALAQLGCLAALASVAPPRRARWWLGLATLAALSALVRPTALAPALASVLLGATWVTGRVRQGGLLLAALGPLALGVTNTLRFDHPLEFGYALNLSLSPLNELALRFGSPVGELSWGVALRELAGVLFQVSTLSGEAVYADAVHPWQAPVLRFRELYFPSFGVVEAGAALAGLATLWATRRSRGVAALWARWGLLAGLPLVLFYTRAPSLTSRYALDLYPVLVALGASAVVAVAARGRRAARGLGVVLLLALVVGLGAPREGPYVPRYPLSLRLLEAKLERARLGRTAAPRALPAEQACPGAHDPTLLADGLDWDREGDCSVGPFTSLFLPRTRCVVLVLGGTVVPEAVRARADWDPLTRVRATALAEGRTELELCRAAVPEPSAVPSMLSVAFAAPRTLAEVTRGARLYAVRAVP